MKNLTLLILGRQPEISLAELQAVFPQAQFTSRGEGFVIAENLEAADVDLRRIGGVVKVAKVFSESVRFETSKLYEFLVEKFFGQSGKQVFGISSYGGRSGTLKTLLIGAKKVLKAAGISSRFVNKDFQNLSSAQAQLELLQKKGLEILVATDNKQWWLAETLAVQPFAEYAKRDYEKAARDAYVGMLPPKLAQALVNLAAGDQKNLTVYDPFCGTGTILAEAALLGHRVIGSDINARMIEYSKKNLQALGLTGEVFVHDAGLKKTVECDVVATEGYLGPPRKTIPDPRQRGEIFAEIAALYVKFFGWLQARRVVITLPFYIENGRPKYFSSTEILWALRPLGWLPKAGSEKLLYFRPDQVVGREIVVLSKSPCSEN